MYILVFIMVLSVCISIFYIFLSKLFSDEYYSSNPSTQKLGNDILTTQDVKDIENCCIGRESLKDEDSGN